MAKRVLMVGFHFPPSSLSSGHLRLLAFARYLPESDWDPIILSSTQCAYEQADPDSIQLIPDTCRVYRAFGLDSKRHLGIRGKYPALFARPDRWISWWPSAICTGLYLLRRYRPKAIWSTYPIMTSHCVAYTLHRLSGIPWVADFRDPVVSSNSENATITKSLRHWERRVLGSASHTVVTAPGAMDWYTEQYPDVNGSGRLSVIGNGYDESRFCNLPGKPSTRSEYPLVLLHSGGLYPDGRNPTPFFQALAKLRDAERIDRRRLKIVLRASGSEQRYAQELRRFQIEDIVTLAPPISSHAALVEQAQSDGLLLFQGEKYDRHIPAKVYEYLRIGRPIFALVGERGDTAGLLRGTGGAYLVPIDNADAIARGLVEFIDAVAGKNGPRAHPQIVAKYSRREGTGLLANLLDHVVDN